ncbi:MAG: tetratricopeptide repeat protein [Candidatus Krumholzibacteriota bacterium]|nr:tetratricopeptide repeat protein [Candidatus Krumholzibacteriota bacterium]
MKKRMNLLAAVLLMAAMVFACSSEEKSLLYKAEKELFHARKLNRELPSGTTNREFVDRTVESYRSIVDRYSSYADSVDGMELIVVSSQMELAELEFRTGSLKSAIDDFQKAYSISGNIPKARANALWSSAFISEQIGDIPSAISLFEKFSDEFLGSGDIEKTSMMNRRYLLVPIRLSKLYLGPDMKNKRSAWLSRGEMIYRDIISTTADPSLLKETRFNLVTALLEQRKWDSAMALLKEMEEQYPTVKDRPSIMFIEAKIEMDGFGNQDKAASILTAIIKEFPDSQETVTALLMLGQIHQEAKRYDEAEKIYNQVIKEHASSASGVVEATWQLANISDKRGNWVDASLHYKSIYTSFPTTFQGMESPLMIAMHFEKLGEADAAKNAYERALEHYDMMTAKEYDAGIRIKAEEYFIRTLSLQKKWEKTAERLLSLPARYPQYPRLAQSFLTAASIYEKELGDKGKAVEALERCVEMYPESNVSKEAEKHINRMKDLK